jgi:S-adenosylmethionine:tRNA ribosyltransferase-isomerase
MTVKKTLHIDEFNYPLPDERIARYPLPIRDASKLLIYQHGKISQDIFSNLSDYLPENSLLIYNNTKVIRARLLFRKNTGAQIEIFCLEPAEPADYELSLSSNDSCIWKCMIGNLKKWKSVDLTKQMTLGDKKCVLKAEKIHTNGNMHLVRLSWNNTEITFADILEEAGVLPIPPYLHRETEESDLTNYQTVYSKIKGSVAAPTAGLHFTPNVFKSLEKKNIDFDEVTLHVGAGTFQPVKTKMITDHEMHTEMFSVHRQTIERILSAGKKIVAVGTTTVRTLESLYYIGKKLHIEPSAETFNIQQWEPYTDSNEISLQQALENILRYLRKNNTMILNAGTQIMIKPGFRFRIVDGMITNFHLPKSTLLLLVSAFVDGNWRQIYDYALNNNFRFLSYGDSSLLMK